MRKFVVLFLGAAFLAAPSFAHSADSGSPLPLLALPRGWDRSNTALSLTADALRPTDWTQTIRARKEGRGEANVILGKHQNAGEINLYMGGTLVALNLATISLSRSWYNVFQGVWIGFEGHSVVWNYRVGVRF